MDKTVIELNAQEAQSFLEWREHQTLFDKLRNLGVFGVRNGHAELHFDMDGNLSSASLHFKVFQKVIAPTAIAVTKLTPIKTRRRIDT